jgi:fermentation-respiration switch protein FrsA (DUF1100 family)
MAGMTGRIVTRGLVPVAAFLGILIGILAISLGMEDQFLYFPTRTLAAVPADYELEAEELSLEAEDGIRLHGWWIRGDGRRALVFFHGNAGNIGDRLDRARILHDRFGFDVFLVDYRGYGRSAGRPSEEGLYRDGRAAYRAALERGFAPERIVLFGESLGSAVAIRTASDMPCAAVVLETPFLSIPEMARVHYPFVPAFLVRSRFDNGARIAAVAPPKLFLVAERDEIVPPAQSRRLYDLATGQKSFFLIRGAGHNDTYIAGGEAYWNAWEKFLEEIE